MITKIFTTSDFIHIAIAACDATGAAADPSVATASFYLVDQITGGLGLDNRIGTNGVATLTKQGSQTGFFGAAVEISGLGAGQWVVLFKATIDDIATIVTDYLCIDPDYRVAHIVASALYDSDADSLLVTAWISFHGEIHNSPYDCTVTLYDETGTQVGEPLVDEVRDARGVFRMTMADAGLTLGSGYYAKIVIYGGSYNCTDLVGVVDIQEALAAYDPPTNAELTAVQVALTALFTAIKGEGWTTETLKAIKAAVDSVGATEHTIENSEPRVYNTHGDDGSTVENQES